MPAGWAAAAGAVVSAGEGIAANQSAQAASKANAGITSSNQGAQESLNSAAEQVANQPYVAYSGQLTAPMSGNQQQANTQASSVANQGVAQADNAAATNLVAGVGNSNWNASTEAQYMNPYTSAVTNAATAAEQKNYEQQLSGLAENSAQSGAFGGSREAIEEGELAGQNQLNQGTTTAQGNASAYNQAFTDWQSNNTMKLNAAQGYEDAGQDVTKMNSSQISDLLSTGGVSQVISQTNLNNQYNQFLRQQGWQANQLGDLISATGSGKGQTTAQPAVQSNTANQLLGLGSTLAGLYGGSSGSNYVTDNENSLISNNESTGNYFGFDANSSAGAGQGFTPISTSTGG